QTGAEIEASLDTELANTRWKEQEVPSGGTTGQVLKKDTNTDFDYSWQDEETGGGGSLDAEDITVTPSGNLRSTDVQVALEELQGDVDGISVGESNPNVFIPTDENDLSDAGNAGKIALVQTTITLTEDLNIAE